MPQRLAEANREQELAAETLRDEQRRELQVQQALREEVKPMAVDTRIYVVGLGEGTYEGYEDGLVELGPRSRQPKHRIKFDMAGPSGRRADPAGKAWGAGPWASRLSSGGGGAETMGPRGGGGGSKAAVAIGARSGGGCDGCDVSACSSH